MSLLEVVVVVARWVEMELKVKESSDEADSWR